MSGRVEAYPRSMPHALRSLLSSADGPEALAGIVDLVRPRKRSHAQGRITALIHTLEGDADLAQRFRRRVRATFAETRLVHVLVDRGILSEKGLRYQLRRKLGGALLPHLYEDEDLRSLMPRLFRRKDDWRWVRQVPSRRWAELAELVLHESDVEGLPHEDVGAAIRALAQRIGATGIDRELNEKVPHVEDYDSPFLDLSIAAHHFLEDHRHGVGRAETFDAVIAKAHECRDIVTEIRRNKHLYGTSLRLTNVTRRLLQQLQRFERLVFVVRPANRRGLAESIAPLLKELVEAEQTDGSVHRVVRENVDLVAFQITEHTARKGEKFVGETAREYRAWLFGAMAGGGIVAVFAVIKLFLAKLDLALAAQAFVYGVNYSACFVLIYLTGSILATKQPAITASAIARRIDEASTRHTGYERVAETIVLVWRSQFVSFLGNVACAIPIAFAIAFGLEQLLGVEAVDSAKAQVLLDGNHPWRSAALFYAGIAGICLFLSGVMQGAIENRIVYTNLRRRLEVHPRLGFFGHHRVRIVDFVVRNLSGVVSNTALGFMLGSAGTVGAILGLPIDIRHIAFSASHVGVAALDAPQLLQVDVVLVALLGIVAIGFVNFVVSFGLTLGVTLTSRQVSVRDGGALAGILLKMFFRSPLGWFLPVTRRG